MSNIVFDFSTLYENRNVYSVRVSTFFKYLDEHGIDLDEYIHKVFVSYKEFYVSCASLVKDSVRIDDKDVYRNYFFRPVVDDRRGIYLKGNIEISLNS